MAITLPEVAWPEVQGKTIYLRDIVVDTLAQCEVVGFLLLRSDVQTPTENEGEKKTETKTIKVLKYVYKNYGKIDDTKVWALQAHAYAATFCCINFVIHFDLKKYYHYVPNVHIFTDHYCLKKGEINKPNQIIMQIAL